MPNQTLIYFANPFEWKLFEEYLQTNQHPLSFVKNIDPVFCRIEGYNPVTINILRKLLPQSIIKSKHRHKNATKYTTHYEPL